VKTFGLTEGQKDLFNLKQLGADADDLKIAKGLSDQLDALEKYKKDQEDAKHLIEQSLTPLDKYKESVQEIARLYREHLIDAKQRQDALNKAQQELDKSDKAKKDEHSAALTRRFDFNLGKNDTAKQKADQDQKRTALNTDRIKFIQEQFYNNSLTKPAVVLYNF